jgi:hypothetical protein
MTMQKSTKETPHRNTLHLRLDDELRARLQEAADTHRFPLIREIRHRLIDSFDTANKRRHESLNQDLEINVLRLGAIVVQLDLGKQLAEAVANDESPKKVKDLARLLISHHTRNEVRKS